MTEADNRALEVLAALEGYQPIGPLSGQGMRYGDPSLVCCNEASAYIGRPWNAWRRCIRCGRVWKVEVD